MCKDNLKDCGGRKTYATCTSYEGTVSEHGALSSCGCNSVHDALEDVYALIDQLYPNVFLDIDKKCLNITANREGKFELKNVIQALIDLQCIETPPTTDTGCTDCADPCTPTNSCCETIIDLKCGFGEIPINPSDFSSWATIPTFSYPDYSYVIPKSGTYKVTVDLGVVEEDAFGKALIGIGINNNPPLGTQLTNPWAIYSVDPRYNSKTFHFVITNLKKDDKITLMFKTNGANIVSIDGIKQLIEKL